MSDRLRNKRAFVTAAGQGIGKATVLAFVREGAEVVATDIDEGALAALQKEVPGIATERLDVRDGKAVAQLASRVGPIQVLFNCAGFVHHGTILECDDEAWDFSLDLNLTSMFRVTRALLPVMLESGGGSIINMSSVASSVTGVPNRFVYGTTKAGIIGLTKSIAQDFVARGIRCNAICPGTVDTPSLHGRIRSQGDYEEVRKAFIARQPMGRIGTPEEVAELVVYLASDESSYTTGQIHVIDGGWCI
jgi:2-keto-3-deoxy-L-fuconate dehydrogenase